MHVGCTEEIIICDIDVFAAGPWLWTDKQPRLIHVVHAIEVVCRLRNTGRTLEIIEGKRRRVTVERTIDIRGTESQERASQIPELREIDRLVTRAAGYAAHSWRRIDRKRFGPTVAPISRLPERCP
jgi:hypothetical protein